ncbi:MAG: hypothetical protein COA99_00700 [Moraxellaceae bacterium]|nr:MAG: hypothetical protein COA99_00700 [Moraxellaceae bacterium]
MTDSDDVVDFDAAKKRVEAARKEQKAQDLEQRFKKAMGWKEKNKRKKKPSSKAPKPKKPRGKGW